MSKQRIPDGTKEQVKARVDRFNRNVIKDPEHFYIVSFRGNYLYLARGHLGVPSPVCRLQYKGHMDNWDFAIYKFSTEKYDPDEWMFPGAGLVDGTIEGAMKAGREAYPISGLGGLGLLKSMINMSSSATGSDKARAPSLPRLLLRLMTFVLMLTAILFVAAGRWDWVMGWVYMAMYACVTVIAVLVVPLDPELIAERTQIKEGVKEWDKRLTVIGSVLYPLAILVVAGLDARYGWSPRVPPTLQVTALLVAAAGNLLSIWATAVNRFYSRWVRIQKERGHVVISDGPYQYLRHPGYLGQIIFSLASALALGSLWALVPSGLFAVLLVVRTALEDRMLQDELAGYKEYTRRVPHRLIPYVW
jgi:protein-S-isoprenylcysteine O-methyltransferase Ste14